MLQSEKAHIVLPCSGDVRLVALAAGPFVSSLCAIAPANLSDSDSVIALRGFRDEHAGGVLRSNEQAVQLHLNSVCGLYIICAESETDSSAGITITSARVCENEGERREAE